MQTTTTTTTTTTTKLTTITTILQHLNDECDKVIAIARKREEFMNKLQKVNSLCKYHIVELTHLIHKVLRILSIKDTYEHFYIENELIEKNLEKFIFLCQRYYDIRFNIFKKDMQILINNKKKKLN